MFALPQLLPFVLPLVLGAPFHPHVPKALVVHGAAGKATVTYFTVPFNEEHLADVSEGFEWHLGFATIETEFAFTAGDRKVPAGKYKLGVVRGEGEADWSLLLEPYEAWRARGMMRRGRGGAEMQQRLLRILEDLQEQGIPERIVVPTTLREATAAEHLDMSILLAGFETVERGSSEPAGGLRLALRMDFGSLHREVQLAEAFDKKE